MMRADTTRAAEWIEMLHGRSRGRLHVCSSGDWTGITAPVGQDGADQVAEYIQHADAAGREGIYLRATSIGRTLGPGERGGAADSVSLPGLWADIDIAGPGHKHTPCEGGAACSHVNAAGRRQHGTRVLPLPATAAEAMAIVREAKLPEPTLIVHSGGGIYPWWLYETPEDLAATGTVNLAGLVSANWQLLLAAAAERLGMHYGSGVGDLARVLRVPGTINRKAGGQAACQIVSADGRRFAAEDLDMLCMDRMEALEREREARRAAVIPAGPVAPQGSARPARAPGAPVTGETPFDDFELTTSWAEILEPAGWTMHHSDVAGTTYWTRPGKDRRDGYSASTDRAGDRGRLYVFSDAAGLPVNTPMNKAHVYGLLNGYGGATKECAAHLRNSGYGRRDNAPTGAPVQLPGLGSRAGQPPAAPVPGASGGQPAGEAPKAEVTWIDPPPAAEVTPQLDDAALYGFAGDFVRSVLPYTEAGAPALLFTLLATVGCNMSDRFYRAAGNTRQTARIWPILCGDTASGAKGTAVSVVKGFWYHTDRYFREHQTVAGLSSGEGLIKLVRDGNDAAPGSGEADPGVVDKRRWVDESEFASTLERGGRDGNTLSAVLRQAYDYGSLQTITSHSPLRATNPHVTVTAHITPAELVRKMSRTDAANGLGNRFLLVHTGRSKYLADGSDVPVHVLERLRSAYLDAREHVMRETADCESGFDMRWTPAASEMWSKVYVEQFQAIEAMPAGYVRDMLGRWHANTTRLAIVYALLDGKLELDVPHLLAALACIRYSMASTAFVFESTVDDTALGKLEEFVAEADGTFLSPDGVAVSGVKRSDIGRKLFRNNISRRHMDTLLRMLTRDGRYRAMRVKVPSGGRPYEVYIRATE